ncbi:MAG: hypothetical protein ACK5MQ_01890 [Pikeienuella sp.]
MYEQLKMNSFIINQAGALINNPNDSSYQPIERFISKEEITSIINDDTDNKHLCAYTCEHDNTCNNKEIKGSDHFCEYARKQ